MLIGLLSDTHIPDVQDALPREVIDAFRDVSLILHGGDIYALSVLNDLERVAPVLAARGDDDSATTLVDPRVKGKHVLELEGHTVWVIHERPNVSGSAWWSLPWWQSRLSQKEHEEKKPDVVVFGHEHRAVVEQIDGTLFVSPGSPTFLHYLRGLGTVGLLEIGSSHPEAQILRL